jgi:hypothetical protein
VKIQKLSDTSTEINLNDGTSILVSYETPVAMYCPFESKFFRTDKFWSTTTSKHINKWLPAFSVDTIEQKELSLLFSSI